MGVPFSVAGLLGSYHVHLGMCILFIYWTVVTCFKGILGLFFSYRSCDPVQKKLEESITFCVL